jgi:hypothetical protein
MHAYLLGLHMAIVHDHWWSTNQLMKKMNWFYGNKFHLNEYIDELELNSNSIQYIWIWIFESSNSITFNLNPIQLKRNGMQIDGKGIEFFFMNMVLEKKTSKKT